MCIVASSAYAETKKEAGAEKQAAAKPAARALDKKTGVITAGKTSKYNPNALRRFDFRIEGKSCAVCLMKIQTKFKETPGVVKVAVMLRRPYGAVVVYDGGVVSKDKLMDIALHTEDGVKVKQATDGRIDKIPTILIPLYKVPIAATTSSSTEPTKP